MDAKYIFESGGMRSVPPKNKWSFHSQWKIHFIMLFVHEFSPPMSIAQLQFYFSFFGGYGSEAQTSPLSFLARKRLWPDQKSLP